MNRAQIYKSAIEGMLKQHSSDSESNAAQFRRTLLFMQELSFLLHTQKADQFRNFDLRFLQQNLFAGGNDRAKECEEIWTKHLLPLVRQSKFPLLGWEPDGESDKFRISHLSFQEYLCASRLVEQMTLCETAEPCTVFIETAGLQTVEKLLGSDRFQIIVQMGRELLSADAPLAEAFAGCFLSDREDGTIHVQKHLSKPTAAITIFSLLSCLRNESLTLE
jgi:hypothetical protein